MNLQLDGKRAVISGSTAGIGYAIAEALAREGTRLVVNGRSERSVDEARARLRGATIVKRGRFCRRPRDRRGSRDLGLAIAAANATQGRSVDPLALQVAEAFNRHQNRQALPMHR